MQVKTQGAGRKDYNAFNAKVINGKVFSSLLHHLLSHYGYSISFFYILQVYNILSRDVWYVLTQLPFHGRLHDDIVCLLKQIAFRSICSWFLFLLHFFFFFYPNLLKRNSWEKIIV